MSDRPTMTQQSENSLEMYDLNCPFCDRVYKLPREKVVKHVGKTIFCRSCGKPFSVPPLPVFESNIGAVIEPPPLDPPHTDERRREISDLKIPNLKSDSIPIAKADPIPIARAVGKSPRAMEKPIRVEAKPPPVVEEPSRAAEEPAPVLGELPRAFAAESLPSIAQVIPIDQDDEPPAFDLHAAIEAPADEDHEPPPYRPTHEHGLVAVRETTTYFHDASTPEGESADRELTLEPPKEGNDGEHFSAAAASAILAADPALHLPPASPTVGMPAGVNLHDAPVAHADEPPSPAPQPLVIAPPTIASAFAPVRSPTSVSIDVSGLTSRLTVLASMSVLIALLLAAILLAMLGYIPHR
ncbi:MAG: hypothetical protein JO353_12720 [Phycisphaerae bacterium]|nr:hypothetical protein [Phycisphaerae bacterium]